MSDGFMSDDSEASDFDMDMPSDVESDSVSTNGEETPKNYVVDAKNVSLEDMRNTQDVQAHHIAGLLDRPLEDAFILLRQYKWKIDKLSDHLVDDMDRVLRKAGITSQVSKSPRIENVDGFECSICCDDSEDGLLPTFAMSCGHRYCQSCYERYLMEKITEDGEVRDVRCPGDKCGIALGQTIIRLLTTDDVYQRYLRLQDRDYVDDHEFLKWCTAPECQNVVECYTPMDQLNVVIPSVSCAAGHTFCFGCSLDEHQPCICSIVKLWLKKCEDDSETANWISANTKECPKCLSTIEKNGGCNHMTCKKCKYDFCWMCMGVWSNHGQSYYNCGRYKEADASVAQDKTAKSRASLERYLHYYKRYANHEQSARLDQEMFKRTESKMKQVQSADHMMSWNEVIFLQDAVNTLAAARRTLKWTYAFAFYLQKDLATAVFEDNQNDFETAVESLSGLCEQPIVAENFSKLKAQVIDTRNYVASRREAFLVDTAKGLAEGRWSFVKSVPGVQLDV